jgi:hypothetical protein
MEAPAIINREEKYLTPQSSVLLKKLTNIQLVEKFLSFYGKKGKR